MTIPVTITKFSEENLAVIPHTKSATKWAEKRMPKQDKEVGHKCHNFAPQQAGNPPWGRIGLSTIEFVDIRQKICYNIS